jgi:hypothetical protein
MASANPRNKTAGPTISALIINMNEFICEKTLLCRKNMRWSMLESRIKEALQCVFFEIGFGASEAIYHSATFAHLCRIKDTLECPHVRCLLHTETFAPIAAPNQLPSGCMRCDIALEWQALDRKRKHGEVDCADVKQSDSFILELKATSTPLGSAAVMQLLCYMKSFRARRGLLCNFFQKCQGVDEIMKSARGDLKELHFKTDNGKISVHSNQNAEEILLEPTIETIDVTLES